LTVAVDLARRLDAIDLDDYPANSDAADWEGPAQRGGVEEQRRLVADLLSGTAVPWSYQASHCEPPAVLAQAAAERDALFIVVGTAGAGPRAALSRLLTPSTSRGLLHRARRPVLIVPDREHPRLG
jgi:nucleotide-binding universal stress UspA family protein